jgi:hypothetical protein
MSNLITIRNTESVHWYTVDGQPRHDADLRTARKERLYPSVTSILSIKRNFNLDNWKVAQLLGQALTMTRDPNESDDQFIEHVKQADIEERAKVPDLGTEVHRQLADYISGVEAHPRVDGMDLEPVITWIDRHVTPPWDTEQRFASSLGYGGCIDCACMVDGGPAIIDWKTQGVKAKPEWWPEWVWQLSAYQHGIDAHQLLTACSLYSVIIDTKAPGCYPKLWTPGDAERGWKGFCGCMEVWKADRKYDPVG